MKYQFAYKSTLAIYAWLSLLVSVQFMTCIESKNGWKVKKKECDRLLLPVEMQLKLSNGDTMHLFVHIEVVSKLIIFGKHMMRSGLFEDHRMPTR